MTRRRAGFRWDWGAEAAHLVAFLALVFVLCWYAGIGLAETVSTYVEEGRFTLAGLVVALNLGMGALLYAALRFAAGTVRLGFLLLFVLGLLVDRVVIETTDTLPSAETISLAYHDRAQASAFFEHFVGSGMILRLLAMALLAIGLLRIAALRRRRVSGVATLGAIVGFVLSVAAGIFLELRTGGAFDSYMEPYRLVAKVSNSVLNGPLYRERAAVAEAPTRERLAKRIVLVMDESIAWSRLSISGYERDTTPYLRSIRDRFVDLGPALSSFNCSMASNYVLTADVRPDDLPDPRGRKSLGQPNIFAWAQRAGYRTMYASAQTEGALTNGMTPFDTKFIDRVHLHQRADDQGDLALVPEILRFLDESEQAFVFVVKAGAHFPWARRKYGEVAFAPIPQDGAPYDIALQAEFRNAYDNLVRWTVDHFAQTLMPPLFEREAMVVYTSDHGQNLFDHPTRIATHCTFTGEIPPEQGIVPLLVFGAPGAVAAEGPGFYSHFHINPSLRYAMGYDVDVDETFFSRSPRKFDRFFAGDVFGQLREQEVPRPARPRQAR